jgi:hypothetical protein
MIGVQTMYDKYDVPMLIGRDKEGVSHYYATGHSGRKMYEDANSSSTGKYWIYFDFDFVNYRDNIQFGPNDERNHVLAKFNNNNLKYYGNFNTMTNFEEKIPILPLEYRSYIDPNTGRDYEHDGNHINKSKDRIKYLTAFIYGNEITDYVKNMTKDSIMIDNRVSKVTMKLEVSTNVPRDRTKVYELQAHVIKLLTGDILYVYELGNMLILVPWDSDPKIKIHNWRYGGTVVRINGYGYPYEQYEKYENQ